MKPSILIVDDEFGLADLIAELLGEAGYEVSIAINGLLAWNSLAKKRPALVLADVMMPVVDGSELLRRMKGDPAFAGIPVVMMTSLPEALPKDDPPLYAGVLNKPFTAEKLFSMVRRFLPEEK
jgi:CheY-like chemotaxis protein